MSLLTTAYLLKKKNSSWSGNFCLFPFYTDQCVCKDKSPSEVLQRHFKYVLVKTSWSIFSLISKLVVLNPW